MERKLSFPADFPQVEALSHHWLEAWVALFAKEGNEKAEGAEIRFRISIVDQQTAATSSQESRRCVVSAKLWSCLYLCVIQQCREWEGTPAF